MFNIGSVTGYLKLNTTGWVTGMGTANASIKSLMSTTARMGALAVGSVFLLEREFAKFDKAMRHATSVSDTTEAQFKQMSEMALDASVKWNKAATETAQAFYWLGSAGLSVTEQMQAFNSTVMLSRAMGSDLGETVEGLIDVVRAFGLSFADTADIADQLTKVVVSSNLDFKDLDASLSYAASTARLTNNTLAETGAMLGIMADAGIKGCYDDQTEVLTRRGWVKWQDTTMEDEFATCDPNTDALEYQHPMRLIRYHHTGKMYHIANRGIDLAVTPDHRMWIKRRGHKIFEVERAYEVYGKDVRYKAGGLHWFGNDEETHTLAGFTQNRGNWDKDVPPMSIDAETWATFLGWYISEGSSDCIKGCYRIRITQNRGIVRDKMRGVLKQLPVTVNEDENGFSINNEQLWRDIHPLGKAPQKHIPQYALDWSPRLLNLLLNAMMEGDGDCNECYYTSSKLLADQVVEVALKIGVSATSVVKTHAGELSNFDKEHREIRATCDQWKVSIKRQQLEPAYYPSEYKGVHGDRLDGSKFPAVSEWVDYDGEVFCAEVPNHLLIVRRNGKVIVSGNSMAGTTLRRAMTNLMSPTGEMQELIYQLGLSIYDSTGAMKPFINIMGEISDRIQNTSEEYRNMVFEILFGRRAIGGQIVLFNYGSRALRQYANEVKNAGGMSAKVAGKQMKALSEILGQLWQQVKRVAIETGQLLAPAFERVADRMKENLDVFREYVKENAKAIMETLKWATVLGAAALLFPPFLLIITNLTNQFLQLALAISKSGFALATNPITWLVAALYTLRATLTTDFWSRAWTKQIKPFLDNLVGGFKQTVIQVVWELSLIPKSIEAAFSGQGILNSIDYFVKALQQIGIVARIGVAALHMDFKEISLLKGELDQLNIEMRDLLFGKKDKATGVRPGIFGTPEERTKSFQEFKASFEEELAVVGDYAGAYKDAFIDGAAEVGDMLKDRIAKDAELIKGLLGDLAKAIPPEMQAAIDSMMKALRELQNIAGIFMKGGLTVGMKVPKYEGDKGGMFRFWIDLEKSILAAKIAAIDSEKDLTVWQMRWKFAMTNVVRNTVNYQTVITGALEGIRDSWATTIESMISGGMSLQNFLRQMFRDIASNFLRMASQIMANKLFYAIFGKNFKDIALPGSVAGTKNSGFGGSFSDLFVDTSKYQSPVFTPDLGQFAGGGAQKTAVGNTTIIVKNDSGTPMNLRTTGQHFDGRRLIIETVLEAMNTDPNVRAAFGR